MTDLSLIVTQGPYSSFLGEVAAHPLVSGIRLNTVMPIKEGRHREKLAELAELVAPKTLWVDLKARQLRVVEFANTPYTAVRISHPISVKLPALACFDNGNLTARVVDIDRDKLILEDYVGRLLGPGESVNIVDESLEYLDERMLTATDEMYVALGRELGLMHFMLSFVQTAADIARLKAACPGAVVMAKIEDVKGVRNIAEISSAADSVMAARGDLYTEVRQPHEIGAALKRIVAAAGEKAVLASRIFESLLRHPVPSCPDMMDVLYCRDMGYTQFMLGDDICFKREVLLRALRIFAAIAKH